MSKVSITVNGKATSKTVEDRTLLVHYLRDELHLTGTHVGCDTSQCGACVVHVDGKAVKSCTMLAAQADGAQVTTIEGIAASYGGGDGELHPMQEAFRQNHGLQCGYLHARHDHGRHRHGEPPRSRTLDEKTIRHDLEGNICRCTGYHNIVKSIQAGAAQMGSGMKQAAE